ncbi:helix-turn-helix domain-containing protein [Duncaniella muris]|jgi:excisionase family DNA binding protein|nr:helix-turn-helix domain-containing protein [Duncaniella muris]ROT04414.1 DNA-binding protein [Muribaculaceae bacterium Isolate-100 (HZI)]RXE64300.1 DNA-binding protein [Muribaculaceae bacterium Isolate-007 (NCI)]RXE67963.1 DNA-binding protein [Muribaculaceae bacterium Isolate-001 (NCI)]
MSSNIRIEKTCEWCGSKFIAQTTVTRFCSKRCAEHSYKARLRNEKVQRAQSVEPKSLTEVKEKDYLTVAETATLLGMTRQGVYKLIHRGELTASKLSSRLTLIKRISIEQMLDKTPYVKRESTEKKDKAITEFYTRAEIREKFGVKDSWIYKVVAENNVPKTILRGKAYFSKAHIDRLFSVRKENPEITEWYSVEDIQQKYGMTLSAIYSLVSKVGIPKRKDGPKVYYSKYHFDVAKGAKSAEDVEFISVADAMEKYSLTRDQLYHYVKTYKITKLRCGKYVKLNAKELAELFNPKIQL